MLRALGSGPRGLTYEEAAERLARYVENTLTQARPVPRYRLLLLRRSLRDPFTAVLLCLGLVSAVLEAGPRPS